MKIERYAYDAARRLVREGNRTYRYGYLDPVRSVTDGKRSYRYAYHADGQLARADYGDGGRVGVGEGGRAGSPLPAGSEAFLWDGLALVRRGDESFVNEPHVGNAPKKLRFEGKPRAQRSARRARKGPRGNPVVSSKGAAYFNDVLGTTVGAKSNGKYSAAALTAFGERLDNVDSTSSAIRSLGEGWFTGKPYVEGLGRTFLMRNYRAGLAKWQTADPIGYPDGWNQLAYCGNGVTECVDLLGAITEHNVSFGWYYEWQGFSIAYNPLLWSFDLPFPGLPVKLWNELAKYIGSYIRGELSDLTPLYEAFLVVEQVDLVSNVRYLAEQKAMLWFDNVISVEVTDVELLKVEELKMDVIKNGNGDAYYVQFEKVKALYLVHMKVIVE